MANTVYDTSFVAMSNGDLAGRKPGNVLDRRLSKIEEFINGKRVAWYNNRLFHEYQVHIQHRRNDLIEVFFRCLADSGRKARRNVLSARDYATCCQVRWPTHDQHLLAAAIEAGKSSIFVTEKTLAACAQAVRRKFRISVIRIA